MVSCQKDQTRLDGGAGVSTNADTTAVRLGFELNHVALARWMAEQHPTIPVILTSGSAEVQKSRAWEASGMRRLLL